MSDPIVRWAAAHRATVRAVAPSGEPAGPAGGGAFAPGGTEPRPTALTGLTELQAWHAPPWCNGCTLAEDPAGRLLLATGHNDGAARIWDASTGQAVHRLHEGDQEVINVTLGPGPAGQILAATTSDHTTARIWSVQDGAEVRTLHGPAGLLDAVAWGNDSDGRSLLAATSRAVQRDTGALVQIWDPESGEVVRVLRGHTAEVRDVRWARRSDGQALLATASWDATARIWDADADTEATVQTLPHSGQVNSVAWTRQPDGRLLLATVCGDGTARIWTEGSDGFTDDELDTGETRGYGVSWAPISDGRLLLAVTTGNALQLWDGATRRRLLTLELGFGGAGYQNVNWTVTSDGRLLLAANSAGDQVHIWEAVLDPPAQPPGAPATAAGTGARGQAGPRGRHGVILTPPEEVTLPFQGGQDHLYSLRLACAVRADGHTLVATANARKQAQIWDASTGVMLHALANDASNIMDFAWQQMPDGRLLLASADWTGGVRIWNADSGQLINAYTDGHTPRPAGGGAPANTIAWVHGQDGRPLHASGGLGDGTVLIRGTETGRILRGLAGDQRYVDAIAEGWLADGRHRLVIGSREGPARIWDPDSGQLTGELAVPAADQDANIVWSAAWGHGPDGRPEVAIGTADGAIRIWDPATGQVLRILTGHRGIVFSLAWHDQPSSPPLLVSGGTDDTARIWDAHAGTELFRLPSRSKNRDAIGLTRGPDGDLLLVIASGPETNSTPWPFRVWRIASGIADAEQDAGSPRRLTARRASELSGWLMRLGNGGLWPPLGLVADLVALTSSQAPDARPRPDAGQPAPTALCDARLGALDGEPGLARLRRLGWGPPARVSFAALLASALALPEAYAPPTAAATLRDALISALVSGAGEPGEGTRWRVPVAALHGALAGVTDQVIALLTILGADACAADPLLPLRVAHHASHLPSLSPRELRLLAAAGTQRRAAAAAAAAGTTDWSPGTAGVARTGPLTRLLPTQLALPREVFSVRLAEDQLLYRQHRAPVPPAPEPVTIILDTTPPTFGPAGNALRLAAHLITLMLWDHGRFPALVTLTEPHTVTEPRAPADLISLWTSATLDDPAAALTAACQTAAGLGQPAVLCTHFHTARDGDYLPRSGSRLLTTHQAPERPPADPASPWHAHLPPNPTQAQLTTVISRLLTAPGADRA